MTTLTLPPDRPFARPLKLALLFSILGEAVLLVVYGLILFPEGSWVSKFMWTILSPIGGAALGWLTFTETGRNFGPDWLK